MKLEDILNEVFEQISEDKEERMKIKIGVMDGNLQQEHVQYRRNSRKIKDDMKLQLKALELEYKRKAEEVIDPMQDKLHAEHDRFWNQVYDEFNLDKNNDYNINSTEKTVYQYLD